MFQTRPKPQLLSEKEAAALLRVSGSTLRRWRSQGIGPAYIRVGGKLGGAIRYRESDLLSWLSSNTVGASTICEDGFSRESAFASQSRSASFVTRKSGG
ncbi:hypothetical protein GCM10007874_02980 [Labrys miyagiensis]|uniref:Helix-turn-helix domain-containing protein n=1 Tax=Labrys miyagiensis TaxID=346912 RepID=A0ABQ6CA72_9HYPH|nr:helix-turn-helix domain-containing protein [Labrys miyagiensis]GLS17283.1 hypothetical protein GCM10007874_02980 [Labrys miyagiensis]